MNDAEIIKALECCISNDGNCDICPQHSRNCINELLELALDLINRQKAKIERLQIENDALNGNTEKYLCESEERSRKAAEDYRAEIKAEAIKEFAERLCEGRVSNDPVVIAVKVELETEGKDE